MGTAWGCSHMVGDLCVLLSKPCNPGDKGCTLYGKAVFADTQTPSNVAVQRREKSRIAQARKEETGR